VPRKKEPSFELKALIWDKAATIGMRPEVILRELNNDLWRLCKEEDFYEDIPDVRTIKRIIEKDINLLSPEVVIAKLPPHVWHLRDDYEDIKSLADKTTQESPQSRELSTTLLIIASNLEKYRNEPGAFLGTKMDKVWDRVYGGWWIGEERAKLGDVDKKVATDLLRCLKEEEEFPELMYIKDWSELNDTQITENFIQRLISRAHRGNF